ncbi:hypothetical protein OBBRIDRAFT_787423 [Obba rivulosa]|uniref:Uncharacterized protein n=1 Tax=Obba rivulosa TaxID=1052685 RepID=A0A8E2DVC7_9APHY|nr:hypothetical protein OBBRIDRAFT_787423 [Obba rivulosa]
MPPQPGVFALPYASTRAPQFTDTIDMSAPYHHHQTAAGPSRLHGSGAEDPKKDKKKSTSHGKFGKELHERREEYAARYYAETISELHTTFIQLATRPETLPAYNLRLYPLSLERSALLASIAMQERHGLDCVQTAYEEERERVEEEWKRGRERIRERLLEGIEERRRRAREEKEGEGTVVDAGLDSQSRPHITRKLRNKFAGTSPPPTPLASAPGHANGVISSISSGPITSGPFLNPHSLSVDELPSPFPLPLTSSQLSHNGYNAGTGTGGSNRRRAKGGGREAQAVGGLGKSLSALTGSKESEIEHDLGEIRRGNKRRRAAAATAANKG